MFGLRQKLLMGFGGLLLILLLVSGLGVAVMQQHRNSLETFLYENWRSVEYGQHMLNALEQLDDIAKPFGAEGMTPDAPAVTAADRQFNAFAEGLDHENHNLTLPGEADLAANLTRLWSGTDLKTEHKTTAENYLDAYHGLLASSASPAQRQAAYAATLTLSPRVRSAAQQIIRLNLDNMNPLERRAKAIADSASRAMILLSAIGVALAVVFIAMVGRSILQPITALTRSAREIEQGNLDLVVQVKSRDELRQLAEAFNSMAAKLREYRRTNRAKLVRTQETTQNAINSLPDAVAILTPEGAIDMANTAAQRLFALRPGEHVSQLHARWLADLFERVARDLHSVEPKGYESAIQVLDEGGSERFFLPHAVPVLDGDHTLMGVTVVLADVTNLRRLDEMKSGMLSVVSHELKTPLTSIRMGVHLLLEERLGAVSAQQNDILVAMREDSDRLNQIVENLLDIGRIEAGRALMDLKSESAETLVRQSTEPVMAAFHDKGVELTVDVPDDVPPVMVDAVRIKHVFSNLLSNALKYTPPGHRVTVTATTADDAHVRFSVEDGGPGIPRQYVDRIFERFFRVPGQSGSTGAGLGLAIAKEIVEAHGGRMSLETTEGVGSRFSFTLHRADNAGSNSAAHDGNGQIVAGHAAGADRREAVRS